MAAKAKGRNAKPIEIEPGSGNVFEDLGLPEAAARLAKAELARVIRKIVTDKGWTQRRAAEALGIASPDMSDLVRGKLARFSQERLERFLNALDMDVRIQVGPRRKGKKHASVTVEFVGPVGANPPNRLNAVKRNDLSPCSIAASFPQEAGIAGRVEVRRSTSSHLPARSNKTVADWKSTLIGRAALNGAGSF